MDKAHIQSSELKITSHIIDSMRSTRPWAMFLSILGFFSGIYVTCCNDHNGIR